MASWDFNVFPTFWKLNLLVEVELAHDGFRSRFLTCVRCFKKFGSKRLNFWTSWRFIITLQLALSFFQGVYMGIFLYLCICFYWYSFAHVHFSVVLSNTHGGMFSWVRAIPCVRNSECNYIRYLLLNIFLVTTFHDSCCIYYNSLSFFAAR